MTGLVKYDEDFKEHVSLRGGKLLRLRLVGPKDREQLRQGFMNLSSASRYKRFMGGKHSISDAELSYFTEIDQVNHFAIGVVELTGTGDEVRGVGVARFIRLLDDSECAEVAITVIDDMQGKGIGAILLEALVEAAVERGIKRFRFECLPQNIEMQRLVRKVCQVIEVNTDTGVVVAEAKLPGQHLDSTESSAKAFGDLLELLRGFATDMLKVQTNIGLVLAQKTLDAWTVRYDSWN